MNVFRRALAYFREDTPQILLLLILIGLSTLLGLLQAWPLAILVDSVVTPSSRQDWIHRLFFALVPDDPVGQIVGLAVITLLLRLVQELINMGRTLLNFRIGYDGLMRVRRDLYRQLQALHLGYHRSQPQGDAIYRLSNDTIGCQTILNVSISIGVSLVTLVVMTAIMMSRSVELTLISLTVLPLLAFVNAWFEKVLRQHSLEARETESEFTTAVQRSLATIGLMQAFGREAEEFARFNNTVRNSTRAWLRLHGREVLYFLSVGTIFGVGGALIFGLGGYRVYHDQFLNPVQGGMTVGDLMIFLTYLGMLYDPLCKLTGANASMQSGVAGAKRVFEVLDRAPTIVDRPDALPLPLRPRTLRLEKVSFAYGEGRQVLEEIDATIRPGEMVAFVGSSGVGKSTLLNLLPRFYDPCVGTLYLDGLDARTIRVQDLRRHVALVLQDSVILPTSVAENIAYGRPDATNEQILEAARLAGAADFIERLPDQYDTHIDENGQNLSGGQRQRLAIARALLTEAPILVLDEPTSALDPEHEHAITEALKQLKGRRTIILVSHRLSTVVDCDRIYVLSQGRIVEAGTHEALVARQGHYFQMARLQLKLEAPARVLAANGS